MENNDITEIYVKNQKLNKDDYNIHKIKSIRENSNEVKTKNDELTLETQKWNPAQEILIEYIKECELTVFEAEKVHDFIRNEIKAKRYKGGNT